MGDLLKQASSPEVLNAAWKRSKSDQAVWEQGLPRKEMEWNLGFHLLKLSDELRTGSYVPNPVRFFPVNKGDGKIRVISANTLRDKVAQRAVLTVIEPLGERLFHPDSFGYRPGRNVDMALERVRQYVRCGLGWVVDADIQSFFDNIPHKPLIRMLDRIIPDKDLTALIRRWLDAGAFRRGFLSSAKGVPQGAVISPWLCNVYLTAWDNEMASRNLPFVRYADDFLVFAKSQAEAEKARGCTEKILNRLELSLNPDKTKIAAAGPNVQFLGRRLPPIGEFKS